MSNKAKFTNSILVRFKSQNASVGESSQSGDAGQHGRVLVLLVSSGESPRKRSSPKVPRPRRHLGLQLFDVGLHPEVHVTCRRRHFIRSCRKIRRCPLAAVRAAVFSGSAALAALAALAFAGFAGFAVFADAANAPILLLHYCNIAFI